MHFIGIDALPHEGIAYVKQGILDATFHYPTGGREAIDTALAIRRGENAAEGDHPRLARLHRGERRGRRRGDPVGEQLACSPGQS